MPTYEYRCKACGDEFEIVQSFSDDALTTCTACGGDLRKVFGNVGISFKGNGFYKNDSRSKSSSSSSSSTASSGDSSSSSSDSGSSSSSTATSDKSSSDKGSSSSTSAPATTSS